MTRNNRSSADPPRATVRFVKAYYTAIVVIAPKRYGSEAICRS